MTIPEDIRDVSNKLIATLPPAFLGLLCINLVFVLGLLWFMHDLAVTRIEALVKIFDACTKVLVK